MKSLLLVLWTGVAFWAGVATQAQAPKTTHPRVYAQPATLQLPCDARGIEEYRRVCSARKRSAATQPKGEVK